MDEAEAAQWAKVEGPSKYFWMAETPTSKDATALGCSVFVEASNGRPKTCKHGAKVTATGTVKFDDMTEAVTRAKVKCEPADIDGGAVCDGFRAAAHDWADRMIRIKPLDMTSDQEQVCSLGRQAQAAARKVLEEAKAHAGCANEETIELWSSRNTGLAVGSNCQAANDAAMQTGGRTTMPPG